MAETPPKDDKDKDKTPDEPAQQNVSGITSENTANQGPLTIAATKKAPSQAKPNGEQPQGDPQLDSKYIDNSAAGQLKAHLNIKTLDPHLEEMLKDAKTNKNPNGTMELWLKDGSQLFAGQVKGKDVIGVSPGHEVDEKAAKAMIGVAKSRGWKTVYPTVLSSDKEKENLWMECQRQGVKMGGYKPDALLLKKWEDEQKNGGQGAKLTNVDPDAPLKGTLNMLKETAGASNDPQLKEGLGKMYEALRTGNLHVDDKLAKGLSEALSDKNSGRDGFNLAVGLLAKAEPPIKIEPLGASPANTGGQPAPRVSQARTP